MLAHQQYRQIGLEQNQHRQHRQFEFEQIQPRPNGGVGFGQRVDFAIPQHADLDMMFNEQVFRLPPVFEWDQLAHIGPREHTCAVLITQFASDDVKKFQSKLMNVSKQYVLDHIVLICRHLCNDDHSVAMKIKCIRLLITMYRHMFTNTQRRQLCALFINTYISAYEGAFSEHADNAEKFVYDTVIVLVTDLTDEFDKLIEELCDFERNVEFDYDSWFIRNRAIRALYAIVYTRHDTVFVRGYEFFNVRVCVDVNKHLLGKFISMFMQLRIQSEFKVKQILRLITCSGVESIPEHSINAAILQTYNSSVTLTITRKLVQCGYNPRQLVDVMIADDKYTKTMLWRFLKNFAL